ncbi:hypothetical protein K2X85_21035 [bacterium]|nr:hypothetical protein [bacterium]
MADSSHPLEVSAAPLTRRLLPLSLLILTVVAVYGSSARFSFLTWDDAVLVQSNPWTMQPGIGSLYQAWTQPFIEIYMPMTYSWWIILAVPGEWIASHDKSNAGSSADLSPIVYHVATLILYVGVVYRVFELLHRFVPNPWIVASACLLYAIHPMQTESVCWISENKGLLGSFFGLSGLGFYVDSARTENPATRRSLFIRATIYYLLALLSKPSMVALPLMAWALEIGFLAQPWKRVAGRLGIWVLFGAIMTGITAMVQSSARLVSVEWLDRPYVAIDALCFYARQTLWPKAFYPDYSRDPAAVLEATENPFLWGGLGWGLILGTATLLLVNRQRAAAGVLLLYLAILAPNLGFIPFAFQQLSTVADRYGSPALLAPCLGLALLAHRVRPAMVGVGLGIGLGVILITRTLPQVTYWQNQETLTAHQIRSGPSSPVLINNRAAHFIRVGKYPEAILDARDAIEQSHQTNGAAYSNLLVAQIRLEDWPAAERTAAEMTKRFPDRVDFLELRAKLLQFRRKYREALPLMDRLRELRPGARDDQFRYARLLVLSGDTSTGLSIIGELQGKKLEGIHADETAAQVFEQAHELQKSIAQYERIIQTYGPERSRFSQVRLAWLYSTNPDESVRQAERGLRLAQEAMSSYAMGSKRTPAYVWDALAAAEANSGNFASAVKHGADAVQAAQKENNPKLVRDIEQRNELYQQHQPYRLAPPSLVGF